ncbi:hypothetical protein MRX96_013671 [Rhipicephalus microplus]
MLVAREKKKPRPKEQPLTDVRSARSSLKKIKEKFLRHEEKQAAARDKVHNSWALRVSSLRSRHKRRGESGAHARRGTKEQSEEGGEERNMAAEMLGERRTERRRKTRSGDLGSAKK